MTIYISINGERHDNGKHYEQHTQNLKFAVEKFGKENVLLLSETLNDRKALKYEAQILAQIVPAIGEFAKYIQEEKICRDNIERKSTPEFRISAAKLIMARNNRGCRSDMGMTIREQKMADTIIEYAQTLESTDSDSLIYVNVGEDHVNGILEKLPKSKALSFLPIGEGRIQPLSISLQPTPTSTKIRAEDPLTNLGCTAFVHALLNAGPKTYIDMAAGRAEDSEHVSTR